MKINEERTIHIREVKPKDFYLAQIIRAKKSSIIPLLLRLTLNPEVFQSQSASEFRFFVNWAVSNVLNENILEVENWLEVSFHLAKQRWGPEVDWLEEQPMSKIKTMISITEKFAEEQKEAMSKS